MRFYNFDSNSQGVLCQVQQQFKSGFEFEVTSRGNISGPRRRSTVGGMKEYIGKPLHAQLCDANIIIIEA